MRRTVSLQAWRLGSLLEEGRPHLATLALMLHRSGLSRAPRRVGRLEAWPESGPTGQSISCAARPVARGDQVVSRWPSRVEHNEMSDLDG